MFEDVELPRVVKFIAGRPVSLAVKALVLLIALYELLVVFLER